MEKCSCSCANTAWSLVRAARGLHDVDGARLLLSTSEAHRLWSPRPGPAPLFPERDSGGNETQGPEPGDDATWWTAVGPGGRGSFAPLRLHERSPVSGQQLAFWALRPSPPMRAAAALSHPPAVQPLRVDGPDRASGRVG